MDKRNNDFDFDFTSIGQAIKKAREKTGMTREQLARSVVVAHSFKQGVLLFLGQIRNLNRRTKSNLPFIYHLQDFGNKLR